MDNYRSKFLLFLVVLCFSSLANAQSYAYHPVFEDDSLYEDANGLSWLRLSHTTGLTVAEVNSQLVNGGMFEGFRRATENEYWDLLATYGYNNSLEPAINYVSAGEFIQALEQNYFSSENYDSQGDFQFIEKDLSIGYLAENTIGVVSQADIFSFFLKISSPYEGNAEIFYELLLPDYVPGHFLVLDTISTPTIDHALEILAESIDAGKIKGVGPGKSSGKRMNALINMIISAGELIEDGYYDEGCQQLDDVYLKCDGDSKPPDFIQGPDVVAFANYILELLDCYSCGS